MPLIIQKFPSLLFGNLVLNREVVIIPTPLILLCF